MDRLTFWGTGDSMGVPRVYCECGVCREARTSGRNRRLRSSVELTTGDGPLLIDCGPDWKAQMERFGRREMKRVLMTHAHFDHMAGLPEWADSCRWTKNTGRLFGPEEVLATVRERYPWLESSLTFHEADQGLSFGGWTIEPFKVPHGKNGFSYAYRFAKNGYRWVYCPDSINLSEEAKAFFSGVDLLVLGTSFYKEEFPYHTRSVYDMIEGQELVRELGAGQAVFTHMSHDVDLGRTYLLPPNIRLAETGLSLELGWEA
ncbi:MBL fold metallo-hydrolase [Paenibacillus aurantius]|uniref:MBL fold metallo-hydrolase n=1 Tax=Paenibacillus aurantius TaxID=2918900 RepID=A0AA96LDV2_9BACL|nr:MBL fold metallo-hydrolase [Paenibacillus aurantius]WNQ11208.1 MBL fold metallo-hydrolase [Paenibacillus aurantius]